MTQNLIYRKEFEPFSLMSLIILLVYFKVFNFSLEVVLSIPIPEAGGAVICHTNPPSEVDLLSQLLRVLSTDSP